MNEISTSKVPEQSVDRGDRVIATLRPPVTPETLGVLNLEFQERLHEAICALTYTLEYSIPVEAAVTALECQRRGITIMPDAERPFDAPGEVEEALQLRITRHWATLLKLFYP